MRTLKVGKRLHENAQNGVQLENSAKIRAAHHCRPNICFTTIAILCDSPIIPCARVHHLQWHKSILTFLWSAWDPTRSRDTYNDLSRTPPKQMKPPLLGLEQQTSALFTLCTRQRWVCNDYKLSQLSCPRLVQNDYELFCLGRTTATCGHMKMLVRNEGKLLKLIKTKLRCAAVRFTPPPHKVYQATLLSCKSSSQKTISNPGASSNTALLQSVEYYFFAAKPRDPLKATK